MKKFLEKFPLPISGLALGMAVMEKYTEAYLEFCHLS